MQRIIVVLFFISFTLLASQSFICVTNSSKKVEKFYESFELGEGFTLFITPHFYSDCSESIRLYDTKDFYYVEGIAPSMAEPIFLYQDKGIYYIKPEFVKEEHDIFTFIKRVDFSEVHTRRIHTFDFIRSSRDSRLNLDRKRLMGYLKDISGEDYVDFEGRKIKLTNRSTKKGREDTSKYLVEFFKSLGLEAKLQCYTSGIFRRKGCNVEATKYGDNESEFVVVGGHYDSVTEYCADDNGTGISTIMEIATKLAEKKTRVGIKFVAFDQEEIGIVGSKNYVKYLKNNNINVVSAFITDTMGYDSDNDGKMHVIDCGKKESVKLSKIFLESASNLGYNLENVKKCTNRSDHSSFWNKNIPAIIISENFFGGDANNCYHRKCDKVDNLNLDYFYRIANSFGRAIDTAVSY